MLVEQLKATNEDNYRAAIIKYNVAHFEPVFEAGYNVQAALVHGEISHGKSCNKSSIIKLGILDNWNQ